MTTPTVPEEELRQLRLALSASEMAPHLVALIKEREPARSISDRPVCQVVDAKYDPGKACSILYRLDDHIVLGRLRWGTGAEPSADARSPAGVVLTLFPSDPALPNLRRALDPETLAADLSTVLAECRDGMRIVQCKVAPVRYRPGRRCTLRIRLWLRDDKSQAVVARTLFGKVYHDAAKATSVFNEMQELSAAAALHPDGLSLAAPAGFVPEMPMVLQRPVKGTPLIEFLGRPGVRGAEQGARGHGGVVQAASALAKLQELGVSSERERPAAAELKKMARRAAGTAMVDPKLGSAMMRLVDELSDRLTPLGITGAEKGLVQGDCKPDQFLIHGSSTTILDFDHCGRADPATDVATFLATLRQLRIRASLKSPKLAAAVESSGWLLPAHQAFLDNYAATRPDAEDFRRRTAWFEAQALLRKAQRGFARSIQSPLPAALIGEAWRCLDALPARGAAAT
jgi:aminoglycoside phosphotransferase (APT) family kinase protein